MKLHAKGNVIHNRMSLKMESNSKWVTSLTMKCHLKWNVTLNVVSIKMEYP